MSEHVTVSDVPTEILCRIFAEAVDPQFHPFQYRESLESAIRTALSISHVNSHFRNVAIYDPHLWNMLHLVNGLHEDLLEAILIRSVPLPFCLSFVEDHTLPSDDGTKTWMLVMEHVNRLGYLSIEVAEGFEGEYAKAILGLRLPSLRRCIVQFRGLRNVFLKFAPLGGQISCLQSLDLTNCYFSPTGGAYPRLHSLAIRNFGSSDSSPSLSRLGWDLWVSRFAYLRHLVLWSCATGFRRPPGRWKLPLLESLVVVGPARLCASIADCIVYPAHCSCIITIRFPSGASSDDAEAGALAATAFLPRGRYDECIIYIDSSKATIRFTRSDRCTVLLNFGPRRFRISVLNHLNDVHQSMDLFHLSPTHPTLDAFSFRLWELMAEALSTVVQSVTALWITVPHSSANKLALLPPFLIHMGQLQAMAISPSSLFSSPLISCISHLDSAMSNVKRLIVPVVEDEWSEAMKAGITEFLRSRLHRGAPVCEVAFAVSPRVVEGMGYAGSEGVKSLLADISRDFPMSVTVEWFEK